MIEGEGKWEKKVWYGVQRFFEWLETKAYKMHVRVLLSRYRATRPARACDGARLKPEALLWRLDSTGRNVHDLMLLPLDALPRRSSRRSSLPAPLDEAADLLLGEVRSRLRVSCATSGLGYLTLDRQSRTLSGGEVQRINLTTALGTSLVNTLFVLDEPSIGLHPRDMHRVIEVMHRLRDAGNSLVVVEHDPQIMLAADRILDLGPGPGERGGEIVLRRHARASSRAQPTRSPAHTCRARRDAVAARRTGAARRQPGAPRLRARGRARAQPQEHRRRDSAAAAWCASPACRARASRR